MLRGFSDARFCVPSNLDTNRLASHYLFRCDHFDAPLADRIEELVTRGAAVTLIVRHPTERLTRLVNDGRLNVIPSSGDGQQITSATLKCAVRAALIGVPIVARRFWSQSLDTGAGADMPSEHPVVALLDRASRESRQQSVVTAVLALQRTGSKYLRDLIGWTVAGRVDVFHEHEVPSERRPPATATGEVVAELARRRVLREMFVSASRRYLFVSERHPVDRSISYFVKRRSVWLHERFDVEADAFTQRDEIEAAFHLWAFQEAARQRAWYGAQLRSNCELGVLDTRPAGGGVLIAESARDTLVVVPNSSLDSLRSALSAGTSTDTLPVASNSAQARGDLALDAAFRRDIRLPSGLVEALWAIPEVAHVHGSPDHPR